MVAEVRWGGPGSLTGHLERYTKELSDMIWAWLLSYVHTKKFITLHTGHQCPLFHLFIIFCSPVPPSFCLSNKTENRNFWGGFMWHLEREMTEMALEVIIKRKHQGRVSDFYLGHIQENTERKTTFCKQKWEECVTFSTTLHWIALLYKEVILKST